MNSIMFYAMPVLVLLSVVFSFLIYIDNARLGRKLSELQARMSEISDGLVAISSAANSVNRRVLEMASKTTAAPSPRPAPVPQEALPVTAPIIQAPINAEKPYEHAIRLVKTGSSVDDLTKSCGISLNEAKLIHKIHGKSANVG